MIPRTHRQGTRHQSAGVDFAVTQEKYFLQRLYWTGFLLQGIIGFIGWYLTFVVRLPFLEDAAFYEEVGHSIATDWLAGRPSAWLTARWDMPHQPFLMVITIACFYVLTLGVRYGTQMSECRQ